MKTENRSLSIWSDFFRHGSNALLALLVVLLTGDLLRHKLLWSLRGYLLAGLIIFFLAEYFTHRFQLHAPPLDQGFWRKLQRRLHYDHHEQPNRLDLLFLPMWYAVPAIALYTWVYWRLSGDLHITQALLLGNLVGLFHYEYVHYVAHLPVTPGTAWGRYMKKYHLWHHYKNEHYWYGVTNPVGDLLFGTYKAPGEIEKSGTTKNLFAPAP